MHEYVLILVSVAFLVFFLSALWLGYKLHGRLSPYSTGGRIPVVDERFRRLTFHFSRKTDTARGSHEPPNFVVYTDPNKETKEAYPIPQYLEPYLKVFEINWQPHDGTKEINEHFKINKIHSNPQDPKYEDLGLVMGWDGLLHLPDLD